MIVDHPPLRQIWSRLDTLLIVLLLSVASLLFGVAIDAGEFWWTDESRHAMDGVFIMDVLKELPLIIFTTTRFSISSGIPHLGLPGTHPFLLLLKAFSFIFLVYLSPLHGLPFCFFACVD